MANTIQQNFEIGGEVNMKGKKGPKVFKALKKSHFVFLLIRKKENYEGQDFVFHFNYFHIRD